MHTATNSNTILIDTTTNTTTSTAATAATAATFTEAKSFPLFTTCLHNFQSNDLL